MIVKKIVSGLIYAISGLREAFKSDVSFRLEAIFLIPLSVFVFSFFSVKKAFVLLVMYLILLAFELINTVIEMIVDKLHPEYGLWAKQVKDIASASVFLLFIGLFILLWL